MAADWLLADWLAGYPCEFLQPLVGPFRCVAELLQALRRSSITRGRYRSLLLKVNDPVYTSRKNRKFRMDKFDT